MTLQRIDPTPAQIKKDCAKIRASWSNLDYANRARHLVSKPVEIKTATPVWGDLNLDQAAIT